MIYVYVVQACETSSAGYIINNEDVARVFSTRDKAENYVNSNKHTKYAIYKFLVDEDDYE